jgi:hypothetical protein
MSQPDVDQGSTRRSGHATGLSNQDLLRAVKESNALSIAADYEIGAVDDPLEQEAKRVADRIAGTAAAEVAAAPSSAGGSGAALRNTGQASGSSGEPLDPETRADFSTRLGHDLSAVRVHTGPRAAASARLIGALAYTAGQSVVLGGLSPHNRQARRVLAHELAHVVQNAARPSHHIRRVVEQYETKGIDLDVGEAEKWVTRSYWEQKVLEVFSLASDSRMSADPEERDAVLAALWQVRPKTKPTSTITRLVTIPKRPSAATSSDVLYRFTFRPKVKGKTVVEAIFVAEGGVATPATAAAPAGGVKPSWPRETTSGFPDNDINAYWKAHPDEEVRVFNWIQLSAPTPFDQVVTATVSKGKRTRSASFHVKGAKNASGDVTSLRIDFLGAVAPSEATPPPDYASHDYADLQIENAQTVKDPTRSDRLGKVGGLSRLPADEQLSVKFAIWQYFKGGTRNAEVDAIVPVANTDRHVLYTLRFAPKTNDVDVERIGEQGKDADLEAHGDLGRVNGFAANSKDVAALRAWLGKRYPGVSPSGESVAEIRKSVTAAIVAGSGAPEWFDTNYKIEILSASDASTRLTSTHKYVAAQLHDLQDFTEDELAVLEVALETVSDKLLGTFIGLKMARQKVSIEFEGKPRHLVHKPRRGGITLTSGAERTIIVFDAASVNASRLFLGGAGPSGKPSVEIETAMTFEHELGHTVVDLPGVRKAFDAFVKAKGIKPVTWYAASNPPKELFPEAFALFQSDPQWLKTNWPKLFGWFDTLSTTGAAPP